MVKPIEFDIAPCVIDGLNQQLEEFVGTLDAFEGGFECVQGRYFLSPATVVMPVCATAHKCRSIETVNVTEQEDFFQCIAAGMPC